MVARLTRDIKLELEVVSKHLSDSAAEIASKGSKNECITIHLSVAAEWQTGFVNVHCKQFKKKVNEKQHVNYWAADIWVESGVWCYPFLPILWSTQTWVVRTGLFLELWFCRVVGYFTYPGIGARWVRNALKVLFFRIHATCAVTAEDQETCHLMSVNIYWVVTVQEEEEQFLTLNWLADIPSSEKVY